MKAIKFALTTFALGMLAACCKEPIPIPETLGAYLYLHQPEGVVSEKFDAYFDLSDGMLYAYSENTTSNALKSVVNKITGNTKCGSVYTMKNSDITECQLRQTQLYNYILDPKSYEMIAPIEETLKQIVEKKQAAFLLTDFEEYSNGRIQNQNYAKKYFIEWLEKGNRIVFYIVDYIEKGKDKHLYFTVFDTPDHLLLKEIDDALKGTGLKCKQFNLNNDQIYYSNNYPAVTIGGAYHDNESGEDIVSCTNESGEKDCYTIYPDYCAEFYPFEASWPDIVKNAKSASEAGNNPIFTHLLSGVVADFTAMSGYNITKLGIVITDIQNDFDKFAGYYAFKKSEGKENAGDDGKILPEYDYEKGPGQIGEVSDMFVFSGHVVKKQANLSIDFRPHFSGTVANMPMSDLLRIDVVIAECEPDYDLLPSLFEWTGNRSLVESVRNTLQDRDPKGKVIYSYFVQALD